MAGDFFIDENSIQNFIDQNGVTVFVDQDGNFLGTGAASGVTTTSFVSSLNPSILTNSVTFTATVVASSGGNPTGTFTFYDGVTSIGTHAVSSATGQGAFTTSALSSGSHSMTSSYGGDVSYDASYSSILTQVVNSPTPPPTGTLIVFTTVM